MKITVSRIILPESWWHENFILRCECAGLRDLFIKLIFDNRVGESTILLNFIKENHFLLRFCKVSNLFRRMRE